MNRKVGDMKKYAGFIAALLCVGCIDSKSLNYQCSVIRATADIGTISVLDEINASASEAGILIDISNNALTFLDTGSISNLTSGAIADELYKLIPIEYITYFEMAFSIISNQSLDLNLSDANIRRIRNVFVGIKNSANDFQVEK